MASFAALVSLQTIIHTLQNHPNPPISLESHQVESLLGNVTFLQDFLERYSHRDLYSAQDLDSLIKSAAYAAEDVIESYIVDRIGGSTSKVESSNSGDRFYQDLQKVVEEMDGVKRKAMEIQEKLGGDEDHESGSWAFDASPAALQSLKQQGVVVGFDDVLEDLLDKLTRNKHSSRQIIPIVGMGGIGKTTLALKAFQHGLVAYHFHIRVWVTISEKFKTRDILIEILCQSGRGSKATLSQLSEDQLGETIHKSFSGMRYLVVMDDMWSTEAWDDIKSYFPDKKNGSVMIVTTRISNLALQSTNSSSIKLNLLDENKSWELFNKTVFRIDGCPSELEKIGKSIVKNCRGLPLSIVVIGALLAKSEQTKQFWEYVARNISGTVNLEDNERCLKILYLSYRSLPIHLKSCFLYMGIFREDARIKISWLVKLLVAEGFLKPIDGMMMEDVVEKYINDLVERNLILVDEWGSTGKIKSCKIHDLLRDLCIREAHKDNFFCDVKKVHCHVVNDDRTEAQWYVGNIHCQSGLDAHRRIVVRGRVLNDDLYPHEEELYTSLESASLVRSIIVWDFVKDETIPDFGKDESIPDLNFRLLRVLTADDKLPFVQWSREDDSSMKHAFQFYNSRYLTLSGISKPVELLNLSSVALFWNLQTLILRVHTYLIQHVSIPIEIWKLPQLRHIYFMGFNLKPPVDDDDFVMWNLTSLAWVRNFKSSEVVKRIPNIKKLSLEYVDDFYINLEQLHKLESLQLSLLYSRAAIEEARRRESMLQSLALFPHSLKKLFFYSGGHHNWDEVNTMMGALPNLQKLTLYEISGTEWRLTEEEGQFSSLKVLKLINCFDLECWTIDGTSFPLLQRLSLQHLPKLKEIPCEIGEIPNIQSIFLWLCSDSCIQSAKRIAEEQEQLGNPNLLQVSVTLDYRNDRDHLRSLASANFKVLVWLLPSPGLRRPTIIDLLSAIFLIRFVCIGTWEMYSVTTCGLSARAKQNSLSLLILLVLVGIALAENVTGIFTLLSAKSIKRD